MDKMDLDKAVVNRVSYLQRNSKKIGSNLAYFGVIIISIFIGALSSIATPSFDGNIITNPVFWATAGIMAFCGILIIYSVGTKHKELAKANSKKLAENEIKIETLVKNTVKPDIEDFIKYKNVKRKVKAWKRLINNKMAKLDKKAKPTDIIIFSSKNEKDKEKNKYCIKKQALLDMLKDEYIEDNLGRLSVKFYILTMEALMSGTDSIGEEFRPINEEKTVLVDNLPRFLYGVAFTIFFSSLVWDFASIGWESIIIVLIKIGTMVWYIYSGRVYGMLFPERYSIPLSELRLALFIEYASGAWKKEYYKEKQDNIQDNIQKKEL